MSVASPLSVEPPWVVHELAAQWFLPTTTVADRLADLHRVVDGWVTAGTFVLAPPLYLGPPDHPVFRALAEHVRARHPDDRPTRFRYWDDVGNRDQVEALLQLPSYTLDAFPVRGRVDLLNEVQRRWRFPSAERPHEGARLQGWLGTYGPDVAGARRSYVVAPLGPVSSVEKWLLSAPGRLEPFGYAVTFAPGSGRYVGARVPLDAHSTADLVGVSTGALGRLRPGDLVVVSLAATCVDGGALDRLMRHVYTLRRRVARGTLVHGLLVSDGATVPLRGALLDQGFDHISLAELGYRDHLAHHPDVTRSLEPSVGTVEYPTSLAVDLAV